MEAAPLMMLNAVVYHLGAALSLLGLGLGGIMMSTSLALAFAYVLSRWCERLRRPSYH